MPRRDAESWCGRVHNRQGRGLSGHAGDTDLTPGPQAHTGVRGLLPGPSLTKSSVQTAPCPRPSRPTPGVRGHPVSRGAYLVGHFSEPHHARLLQPRVPGVQRVHAVPEEPAGDGGLLTPPQAAHRAPPPRPGHRGGPVRPTANRRPAVLWGTRPLADPNPHGRTGRPRQPGQGGEPPQCRWAASPRPQGLLGCSTPEREREEQGSRWRLGPRPGRGRGLPHRPQPLGAHPQRAAPGQGAWNACSCAFPGAASCAFLSVYQEHLCFLVSQVNIFKKSLTFSITFSNISSGC